MPRLERYEVELFIRSSWDAQTALPYYADIWSMLNPSLGQCDVTALLIQDIWGGELVRTTVEGYGSHYYNRLPGGEEIDLTGNQFPSGTVIPPGLPVERSCVLDSESAVWSRTAERYRILRLRFDQKLYMLPSGF